MEVLRYGYRIPFLCDPPLPKVPIPMPSYHPLSTKGVALGEVTQALIAKSAVELAPLPSLGFYSRLFVVLKTSGSWRPVIDLSTLNLFVDVSHFKMETVIQPLYESRMNWVYDPAPPASRRATVDFSDTPVDFSNTPVNTRDTPASAIISASPGAPLASPHPKKSRRRRNRRSANQNSAPRSAATVTPDERWANKNSASQRATQPQSAASDPSQMMSTPVYQDQSFHSSHLPQPPVPAGNRNAAFQFGLDRCRFRGLYKPAHPDPRQDLTATLTRVNNSGSGFSSPSLLQPCTKPFSGLPARQQMTCPTREAGEATRERPGVVYPLMPRAQPPKVLEIGDTSLPQQASSPRRRSSRRQSRKCRCNRSTGVYRPPKRSPPQGRWCE